MGGRISSKRRLAKRYRLGTHRVREPAATWEWIRGKLGRFGITRVADVTALDRLGIPVFQAIRPASRNISVSQGKAPTPMGARVSAVMEAIELWHAEDLSFLPQAESTLKEMRTQLPFALDELLWLPRTARLDNWPLPWVEAASLRTGESTWLPRAMLELDFTVHPRLRPQMFHRTSNGLASGNCREEALVHALCELIERHALHLGRRRVVAAETVEAPGCGELLEPLRRADARLEIFDLTWEIGVPVIAADLCLSDLPRVFSGSGCHPDPGVALSRALTEAVQSRLTVISGSRDDLELEAPPVPAYEAFESFEAGAAKRSFDEIESVASEDLAVDLELLIERLTRLGHEPYAVDLTREEIPVVRVFAPGLGEAHE